MNDRTITAMAGTPLNRLFIAINHYVSTGDHLGEGTAIGEGIQRHMTGEPHALDLVRLLLMENTTDPTDVADFAAFASRFSELAGQFDTHLKWEPQQGKFRMYSFVIKYGQANELANALTEQPGPAGWGSMKELIDEHYPG